MRLTFPLIVTAAGMMVATEIVPLLSEKADAACYSSACPAIVPVERHYRFTDVGSHGPGFDFAWRGPIAVITPMS